LISTEDDAGIDDAAARSVLLMTAMPPAPMVPTSVTPPLKVVWTTMAAVLPPNVVG
jgi:hypothetical protein